jgi:hypothetical protein
MFPSLPAIQTGDKDGRRLIGGSGLHLIIGTLALVAPITLVFIRGLTLVPFQNLLFPNKLLVSQLLPPLREHIIGGHGRNLGQWKFTGQTPFQKPGILDKGPGMNIP